ncbi:hypothetical protein Y032_0482g2281 [Ancylostoma ceylanicum]|uniref:Uncharacterized protein n=1 Tax=Ancylostoma ceylanicum TaxID=53326 RepID=A0A016WVN7_9BILA|nr:hypothetical protein Y032_0482g2281 [Ancylostoma ceylanicum]
MATETSPQLKRFSASLATATWYFCSLVNTEQKYILNSKTSLISCYINARYVCLIISLTMAHRKNRRTHSQPNEVLFNS